MPRVFQWDTLWFPPESVIYPQTVILRPKISCYFASSQFMNLYADTFYFVLFHTFWHCKTLQIYLVPALSFSISHFFLLQRDLISFIEK